MIARQDPDFAEYVSARIPALRRLALVLCRDWHFADDLVQATLTKLCQHWSRAAAAESTDAYVRGMLVREFLRESRSPWARRVDVTSQPPELQAAAADLDGLMDLQAAVSALPPRQRAVLVLRYFLDLPQDEVAAALRCSLGTVKSTASRGLARLEQTMPPANDTRSITT